MRKALTKDQWERVWNHYSEDEDRLSLSDYGSAQIYPRGETKVVRVSNWDTAYLDFAHSLWEGEFDYLSGNCFPDIYSIHYMEDEHRIRDGASVIVIERLEELLDLGYDGIDDFFGTHWRDSIYDYLDDLDEYLTEDARELFTQEFMDAYDVMLDEAHDRGWNADIHGYNVMVRIVPPRNPKTGRFQKAKHELVIIDPWC